MPRGDLLGPDRKNVLRNDQEDARRIGFDDSFIYEEIALPPAQRRLRSCRILSEEARKAFVLWDEKSDKREY